MEPLKQTIRKMITISDAEMNSLLGACYTKNFASKDFLSDQDKVSEDIYFILAGMTRSLIRDRNGLEHTIHFSVEGQFIADYTSFMLRTPATNGIQAIERTEVVVMPRSAIEWGYANMQYGDKLGRLIAEYYFVYFDNRLKNQYIYSPSERYDHIAKVFPNIHNRVPQHMIASYLGVSPVHLSRLKRPFK